MKPHQLVQVVTNRKGTIVAVLRLPVDESRSQTEVSRERVEVRLTPLPGQVVTEVRLPDEVGALDTAEDFRRLVAEFDLPRKATALRRKRVSKGATARKRSK